VYRARAFSAARTGLGEILGDEIDVARKKVARLFAPGRPRILAIDRGEAHPFYLSASAEAKSAGTARRSGPNHGEIVEMVSRRAGPVLSLKLENLPLAQQIALFSAADMIIAQHGAALSNLIWAKPGAGVIEIMPKTAPKE